jgi:hypothetical protein
MTMTISGTNLCIADNVRYVNLESKIVLGH